MAVGLGIAWVGYTLAYFGLCSLRGPGVGLLDLVIPGRLVIIPPNTRGQFSADGQGLTETGPAKSYGGSKGHWEFLPGGKEHFVPDPGQPLPNGAAKV